MKVRTNYLITCLAILYIFIPIMKWQVLYLVILFTFSLISNGCINKVIYKIDMFQAVYVFTFIGSYFIHYYDNSINNTIFFISSFFIARYLIIKGLKTNFDVEKFIDFILSAFTIYAILGIIESITKNNFNIFDIISQRNIVLGYANEYRGSFFRNHGLCTISINNALIVFMVWMFSCYKSFKFGKTLHYISLVFLSIDLLMIFSRAVLLIAAVMFILLFKKARSGKKLKFAIIIAFLFIILILVNQNEIENFKRTLSVQFYPLVEEFIQGGYKTSGGINKGSGQRFALFGWVASTIKNNFIFGFGFVREFAFRFTVNGYTNIKNSIEVQWLYVLFQKGFFGLIGFILYEISCVRIALSSLKIDDKKRLNLSLTYTYMIIGYFVGLFDCAAFEDLLVFYALFNIFEAYWTNLKKENGNQQIYC